MKLPNILSLSRVVFLFVIGALLFAPYRWTDTAAFFVFIIAALTDWADGYVARKFNMVTDFGKLMDALADKVLMTGMFVNLIAVDDLLPWWSTFLILIIMSREFLITGLRLVAASKGVVLAAEQGGKIKTVFQIVAIALLILTLALRTDFEATVLASWAFIAGIVLLFVATALTLHSGYTYFSKYGYLFQEKAE